MASLTPEDVIAFIKDRWRQRDCPRCGQEQWHIGAPDNFKGLMPLGDDDASSSLSKTALPVNWLVCGSCGHVEFIGTKILRAWKDIQLKSEGSEDA